MTGRSGVWGAASILAGIASLLAPSVAEGIPAFARRYQTSCTTCHVVVPRLNPFGVAFRNNGYRIPPHDEAFVKTPDVPLGAPAWKRVWPDAIWPGGIPGIAPVSFRVVGDAVADPSAPAQVDFVFPNEVEILAGGTAGDGISYFIEVSLGNRSTVEVSRAFAQFDRIGGTTLANLAVGRFEIRAVPFSRYHNRLTASDLLAMDFRQPADGLHLRRPQAGLEFWGAKSGPRGRGGFEYAIGVVNGNGPGRDNNTAKDWYTRAAYKFGGFGVTGSSAEAPELATSVDPRTETSLRVGTSTYVGRGRFEDGDDAFWRLAADADVFWRRLNVSAVVVRGHDEFQASGVRTRYTAASIESNYLVKPWIVASLRYDAVRASERGDVARVVPAVVLALRANVRLVTEWERFTTARSTGTTTGNTLGRVRLDLVF